MCYKLQTADKTATNCIQNCSMSFKASMFHSLLSFIISNSCFNDAVILTGIVVSKSHHKHPVNGSLTEIILSTVFIVVDINFLQRPDVTKDIMPSKYCYRYELHCRSTER